MRIGVLFLIVAAGGYVFAQATESDLKTKVESLLKSLGSDDWLKRQEAEKKLLGMGVEAGDILWERLKSVKDAELRTRIERILKEMGHVPAEYRNQLKQLFGALKGDDILAAESAFLRIVNLASTNEKAKRWIQRFAKKFFGQKTSRSVKVELNLSSKTVRVGVMPRITLTVENKGKEPAWVPLNLRVELRLEIGERYISQYFYPSIAVRGRVLARSWGGRSFGMTRLAGGEKLKIEVMPGYTGGRSSRIGAAKAKFEFGQQVKCTLTVTSDGSRVWRRASASASFKLPTPVPINVSTPVVALPTAQNYYGFTTLFLCPTSCKAGGKLKVRFKATTNSSNTAFLDRFNKDRIVVVATDGERTFLLGEMKPQRREKEVVAEAELPAPKKPGTYRVWALAYNNMTDTIEQVVRVLPQESKPQQKEQKKKEQPPPQKRR